MTTIVGGEGLGLFNTSLSQLNGYGAAGRGAPGSGQDRVYVNAVTGNLVVQGQDDYLASVGIDTASLRTYNSLGLLDDDNGDNWRLSFHAKLLNLPTAGGTTPITRVGSDGHQSVFTWNGTKWVSTDGAGAHDTISLVLGQWVYEEGSSLIQEAYDASGRLVSVEDRDGNTTSFTYTTGQVAITDGSGQITYLDYTGNNLTQIRVESSGVTRIRTRYEYDGSGRLWKVKVDLSNPGNATQDSSIYITTYNYDGTSKRVSQIRQSDQSANYVSDLRITYVQVGDEYRVSTLTTMMDGAGSDRVTTFNYDLADSRTDVFDAMGGVTRYHYDSSRRLVKAVLPEVNGVRSETTYSYLDGDGNINEVATRVGSAETRRTYHTYGNGNLLESRDDLGNTVRRTYTATNQIATETVYLTPDPDGAGGGQPGSPLTTEYLYDGESHLRFVVSPEGRVTEHRYHANGNREWMIRYLANYYTGTKSESALAAWAANQDATKTEQTRTEYDFRGQVQYITRGESSGIETFVTGTMSRTYFVYSPAGELLQTIDPRGNATVYSYDGLGRMRTALDSSLRLTTTTYDDANNRIVVRSDNYQGADPAYFNKYRLETTSVYNRAGELLSQTQVNGNLSGTDGQVLGTTSYHYDNNGRLRMVADPAGYTHYLYDARGWKIAEINQEGELTETIYNDAGQVIRTIRYDGTVDQALLVLGDAPVMTVTLNQLLGRPTTASNVLPSVDLDLNNSNTAGIDYRVDAKRGIAVPIGDTDLTLSDGGDNTSRLQGATVYILNRKNGTDEQIFLNGTTTLTVSYDAAKGQLTLSGDATVATYQTALRNLRYRNDSPSIIFGSRTIEVVVRDASDKSKTARSYVNVVNTAPVAINNGVYSLSEDTTRVVAAPGVLANDSDADGHTLSAILVSPPTHGTVVLNANGSFSYTPHANYNGSDSFTYRASDGMDVSGVATVLINVLAVNDAPITSIDTYSTNEDTQLTVAAAGVLANDSDVEGSALTAVSPTQPAHGTVVLNSNGSFTYTPHANYSGADSFTYRANDGVASSAPTTVNITVVAVDDAPVAVNDTFNTVEDAPLSVAATGVLGNDTDGDGNPLSAVLVGQATNGSVALNANGSFTYTPNANFSGTDSFTYRASDGGLTSNLATVTINVGAVNDAPVAGNDSYTTAEDTPLMRTIPGVLGNDSDADNDTIVASVETGPAHGTLQLNGNGAFTYTPIANYNGPDSFTYKVYDGQVYSAVATVSLTVTAVNDLPTAQADSYNVTEDVPLTTTVGAGVLANDADLDGPLTAILVSQATHGAVVLNSNGAFTYTPQINFHGVDSFTYKASDGTVDTAPVTVTINVAAVNDAPAGTADSYTTSEDTALIVTTPETGVLGNDSDADGDAFTAVLVRNALHGTVTLNTDGTFTYVPTANYFDADSFIYRANDGTNNSSNVTVSLTVTPVNDAPQVDLNGSNGTGTNYTAQATATSVNLRIVDTDLSISDVDNTTLASAQVKFLTSALPTEILFADTSGAPLAITGVYDPLTSTLNLTGNGTVAQYQTVLRTLQYINPVPLLQQQNHVVQITVSDGNKTSNVAMATIIKPVAPAVPSVPAAAPEGPAAAAASPTSLGNRSADYVYDRAGRLVFVVDAERFATETTYDGAGRAVKQTSYSIALGAGVALTETAIRAALLVNGATDAASDRSMRSFYGSDGLQQGMLDAEGYLTGMVYDAGGRLAETVRYAKPTTANIRATGTYNDLVPAADVNFDAHNQRTYCIYDDKGQKVGYIDALGFLTVHQYDASGNKTRDLRYSGAVTYGASTTLQQYITNATNATPASQPISRDTSWTHDNLNRVLTETNAEGTLTTYEYHPVSGFVTKVTRTDRSTTSEYDALGRVTRLLGGEGSAALSAATNSTEREDVFTQYGYKHTYDLAGRRISTTGPQAGELNTTTLYYYDRHGRVRFTINPAGEISEARYNAFGEINGSVQYAQALTATELGNVAAIGGGAINDTLEGYITARSTDTNNRVSSSTYTLRGDVDIVTDALLYTTNFDYNAFKQAVKKVFDVGATPGSSLRTDNFSFDRRGLLTESVEDFGGVARTNKIIKSTGTSGYDAFGRVVSTQDANGHYRTTAYDRLGRVVTATDPAGNVSYTYDAHSRVLTQTDRLNTTTSYQYSDLTRSSTVTTPEGIQTTRTHSEHGQEISITLMNNGVPETTTYAYDLDGRLERVTDSNTFHADNAYDTVGKLQASFDKNGVKTQYTYDAANRVLSRTVDAGVGTNPDTGLAYLNLETRYEYSAFGEVVKTTNAEGVVTETSYDRKGRTTAIIVDTVDRAGKPAALKIATTYTVDAEGRTVLLEEGRQATKTGATWTYDAALRTTSYTFDKLGRRIEELLDPGAGKLNITATYSYDAKGNLTSSLDGRLNASRWVYDAMDRVLFAIDQEGAVTENGYDAEGRLIRSVRFSSPIATTSLGSAPTEGAIRGLLIHNAGTDRVTRFVLDADGRQIFAIQAAGETWNGTQWQVAAGGLQYLSETGYDAGGRVSYEIRYANALPAGTSFNESTLRTVINAGGFRDAVNDQIATYEYDSAGRVKTTTDAAGYTESYEYDDAGNRIEVTNKKGDTWRYFYDEANRLIEERSPLESFNEFNSEAVISAYKATLMFYDTRGNVTDRVEGYRTTEPGNPFIELRRTKYVYDARGLQVRVEHQNVNVYDSTVDALGGYLGRNESAATMQSQTWYDDRGMAVVNRDVGGNYSYKVYDKVGRLKYSVDAERHLTAYSYDGNSNITTMRRHAIALSEALLVGPGGKETLISDAAVDSADARSKALDTLATMETLIAALSTANARDITTTYDLANRKDMVKQPTVTYYLPEVGTTESAQPTTDYDYNAFGEVVAQKTLRKAADWITTYYGYDQGGRQTHQIDGLGHYTKQDFDAFGRMTQKYEYAERLSSIPASAPDFAALAPPTARLLAPSGLDANGPDDHDADGYDRITRFTFDQVDQMILETMVGVQYARHDASDGSIDWVIGDVLSKSMSYDAVGNVIAVSDASGAVTRTYYDKLGRAVAVVAHPRVAPSATNAASFRAIDLDFSVAPKQINFGDDGDPPIWRTVVSADWSSLASWGDGDVKVRLVWSSGGIPSEQILPAGATVTTFRKSSQDGVSSIEVFKYINGQWVSAYATTSGHTAPRFELLGADTAVSAKLYYRQAGQTPAPPFTEFITLTKVGPAWLASIPSSMTEPNYDYSFKAVIGTTEVEIHSGGFALARPAGEDASVQGTGGSNEIAPLTVMGFDALGNQVAMKRYAQGAKNVEERSFDVAAPDAQDQTSYLRYDLLGRVIESKDAAGESEYTSYDAFGKAAKIWRTQTDVINGERQKATLYQYNRVGLQTATIDIVRSPTSVGVAYDKAAVQFNAFGEQIAKGTATVSAVSSAVSLVETATYNADGRLIQTNAGGVAKLYQYDLQGNLTATSEADGSGRVEYVRDKLGRVTEQREASYEIAKRTALAPDPARLLRPTILPGLSFQREFVNAGEPYWRFYYTASATWSSVAGHLASPRVRFTLDYTDEFGSHSLVRELQASSSNETGGTFSFDPVNSYDPVYQITADRTRLEIWDNNAWVLVRDSAATNTLELLVPQILGTSFDKQFKYRPVGGSFSTVTMTQKAPNVFTVSGLANGSYEYEFSTSQASSEFVTASSVFETYTGTFNVSAGVVTLVGAPQVANTTYQPVLAQTIDRWGNVIASKDPRNQAVWVTNYRYDHANRLLWMQQPTVDVWSDSAKAASAPITRYYHDVNGLTIAIENALGAKQRRFYDAAGQLILERNAANTGITRHVYDGFGREVRRMLPNAQTMDFGYDKLNRLVWQQTHGYDIARFDFYAYDELGNRIGEKRGIAGNGNVAGTGAGGLFTRYHYDTKGRLVQVLTPMADANTSTDAFKTTYTYDARDRRLTERNGLGDQQTWNYDDFRLQSYVDIAGVTTNYTYTAYGQMLTAINQATSQALLYGSGSLSTHGQSLQYSYYNNGRLKTIRDSVRGQTTYYEYDVAGNRTVERIQTDNSLFPVQDVRVAYDALGRMARVADQRYVVDYAYDAAGNRRATSSLSLSGTSVNVTGTYSRGAFAGVITVNLVGHGLLVGDKVKLDFTSGLGGDGIYQVDSVTSANSFTVFDGTQGATSGSVRMLGRVKEYWYKYDADNRIIVAQGVRGMGSFPITHSATQGTSLSYDGAGNRTIAVGYEGGTEVTRTHTYDPSNLIAVSTYKTASTSLANTTERTYDQLGRLISYIDKGTTGTSTRSKRDIDYDANGRISKQRYYAPGTGPNSWNESGVVEYTSPAGNSYDAAGNLKQYKVSGFIPTVYEQTYTYAYIRIGGGYKERIVSGSGQADSGGFVPGITTTSYDVNGNANTIVQTGQADRTFVTDTKGLILKKNQSGQSVTYAYANDKPIGDFSTDPAVKPDFDYNYTPVSESYPARTPGQYITVAGDTAQKIAYSAYGDSSLWYLIADANGLSGGETLAAGRTIKIPNRVTNIRNDSTTFRPYDPSQIVGDTTPQLEYIPPPPPKDKCAEQSQILGAVVAVVVFFILDAYLGAYPSGTEWSAATAAAVGNTVSQMAYLSHNGQFDWEKFAVYSPLGANIASEKASNGQYSTNSVAISSLAAFKGAQIGGMVEDFVGGAAGAVLGVMAGAAAGSITAQGLSIAVGDQDHFSWRQVAISAVAAGASWVAGQALGALAGMVPTGQYWGRAAARVAGDVASQAVHVRMDGRGKISWAMVAVNAFGNAIGNSIVAAGQPGSGAASEGGGTTTDESAQAIPEPVRVEPDGTAVYDETAAAYEVPDSAIHSVTPETEGYDIDWDNVVTRGDRNAVRTGLNEQIATGNYQAYADLARLNWMQVASHNLQTVIDNSPHIQAGIERGMGSVQYRAGDNSAVVANQILNAPRTTFDFNNNVVAGGAYGLFRSGVDAVAGGVYGLGTIVGSGLDRALSPLGVDYFSGHTEALGVGVAGTLDFLSDPYGNTVQAVSGTFEAIANAYNTGDYFAAGQIGGHLLGDTALSVAGAAPALRVGVVGAVAGAEALGGALPKLADFLRSYDVVSPFVLPRPGTLHGVFGGGPPNFRNPVVRNYRGTFFAAHPELRGSVVIHHGIEQNILKTHPKLFTPQEIHALENLRGIPKPLNRELHLRTLRKEWNAFYLEHPHPTRAQLLQHRSALDVKYGSQFLPPVKPR